MEALSCGTPCIAFKTGGIPEMITHGSNGFLARYASPESLAEGINFMIKKEETREMEHNARRKVLDEYAEEVVAKQYINLYEELYAAK